MINNLLTVIIFLPMLAALGLLLVPSERVPLFRWVTIGITSVQLILSLVLWVNYDGMKTPTTWADSFQFITKISWIRLDLDGIGALNVDYFIGLDGISLPMIVLSSLILLIGAISSWTITVKVRGFYVLYLILGASIIGCFAALDFFLFYLFFEFMLLPMFFLIGIWGGKRRQYASVKFFIYTLVGSLFILVAMIALFLSVKENGSNTFSLVQMMNSDAFGAGSFLSLEAGNLIGGVSVRTWAFWLLVIGFLIKLPAVPVHTWLPDAHVEAPTSISVVLAGLLLKIGGYGLFRIAFPIFPEQAMDFAMPIAIIGLVAIIYAGLSAMAQTDLKRLVAYSSVSHMGFVLVGLGALTVQGLSGGLFQMVSHGILSPALFLLVGVLYDRTGDREISNFNGLASQLPKFTFFLGFFFFASLGLPGLSGFVGELLVLLGAFQSTLLPVWIGPIAVLGILISAAYFIWTIQRMFFGKYWVRKPEWNDQMIDLSIREWLMLSPLALLVLVLGVYPSIVLGPIQRSLEFWVEQITQVAP